MYHITVWYWHNDNWEDVDAGQALTLDQAKQEAEQFWNKKKKSNLNSMSVSNLQDEIWKKYPGREWIKQVA